MRLKVIGRSCVSLFQKHDKTYFDDLLHEIEISNSFILIIIDWIYDIFYSSGLNKGLMLTAFKAEFLNPSEQLRLHVIFI